MGNVLCSELSHPCALTDRSPPTGQHRWFCVVPGCRDLSKADARSASHSSFLSNMLFHTAYTAVPQQGSTAHSIRPRVARSQGRREIRKQGEIRKPGARCRRRRGRGGRSRRCDEGAAGRRLQQRVRASGGCFVHGLGVCFVDIVALRMLCIICRSDCFSDAASDSSGLSLFKCCPIFIGVFACTDATARRAQRGRSRRLQQRAHDAIDCLAHRTAV